MTWQQYLTEKVLKECWHTGSIRCEKCGKYHNEPFNHTFDNAQDLHDVYSAVERDREWWKYEQEYCLLLWDGNTQNGTFNSWLFCLNGKPEDFEARCKMVAEFYGWEKPCP